MLIKQSNTAKRRLLKKAKKLAIPVSRIGRAKSLLYSCKAFSSVQLRSWSTKCLTTNPPMRIEKKKRLVATKMEKIEKRFSEGKCWRALESMAAIWP